MSHRVEIKAWDDPFFNEQTLHFDRSLTRHYLSLGASALLIQHPKDTHAHSHIGVHAYTDYPIHTHTRTHTDRAKSWNCFIQCILKKKKKQTIALSTALSVSPDLNLTGNTFSPLVKVSVQLAVVRLI